MNKDVTGKVAVVTGASSGIGLCFCRELAGRGCNLVMISNQESLDKCASEVAAEFDVRTVPFFCDLTEEDCDRKIIDFLDEKGIEVDFLINNAGIFSFAPVSETSPAKVNCFVDLHVRAVTTLSRMFALRFLSRGSGRILNMSSMSCWMPMPGIALYSATKAYIRVFSRALHYEMVDRGVTVTVACPGGIATDLFGLPENLKKLALTLHAIQTPEKFTHKAVDKMLKGKKQYINGYLNRMAILFVSILPTRLRLLVKRLMLDRGITR